MSPEELIAVIERGLAADEAAAKAWLPFGNPDDAARAHIARHDPGRVLADVESKRAILAEHGIEHPGTDYQYCRVCHDYTRHDAARAPCRTLQALARPYLTQETP